MKRVAMIFLMGALLIIPQFQTDVEAADQYACVKKKNGQFRLVLDPADCRPSEYSVEFEVNDESEIEGEMCWTNAAGDCTLHLKFESDGTLYSLIGSEMCTVAEVTVEKHAYGSGRSNVDGTVLNIGLTYTGLNGDTGVFHEGRVFAMDLTDGFGLVKHRESNSEDECGLGLAPCVIVDEYTPIPCPE